MKRTVITLSDRLDEAELDEEEQAHFELQTFVVDRIAFSTIFQHPPSKATWRGIELGSAPELRFVPLIKPAVWDRLASDVVFSISLTADGEKQRLFKRALNPRKRRADREAREHVIDLGAWSNRPVDIEITTASRRGKGVPYGWSGWGELRIEQDSAPPAARMTRPKSGKPNLVLVTCDALRRDHLGCYGATTVDTPNIDALAHEGLLFEHARAQSVATLGSYCSLLTGCHPLRTGVDAEWGRLPSDLATLPSWLARHGYRTVMAPSEHELDRPHLGIRDPFHDIIPVLGNPAQPSAITVSRALRHLERLGAEPFFLWLQLFEPHPPQLPSPTAARRKYDGDPTSPERADRPELIAKIHGVETLKEMVDFPVDPKAGRLPTMFLKRLQATLAALNDPSQPGPDLAAHIASLGERGTGGKTMPEFTRWLAAMIADAEEGRLAPEFLSWLDDLKRNLAAIEREILGWIDGVVDFRYPEALYAATVECVDAAIGGLRKGLEQLGLFEDTILVFTAPHGECLGEAPAIFQHHVPAEVALHVPLVVKLPPTVPSGSHGTIPHMFELVDLFPTIADWLELTPPPDLDGRSRAAGLAGGEGWSDGTSIALGSLGAFETAFRDGYKLVRICDPDQAWPWHSGAAPSDRTHLFREDDEATDLSAEMPELKSELTELLKTRSERLRRPPSS